jgi:hypothetical protein
MSTFKTIGSIMEVKIQINRLHIEGQRFLKVITLDVNNGENERYREGHFGGQHHDDGMK